MPNFFFTLEYHNELWQLKSKQTILKDSMSGSNTYLFQLNPMKGLNVHRKTSLVLGSLIRKSRLINVYDKSLVV